MDGQGLDQAESESTFRAHDRLPQGDVGQWFWLIRLHGVAKCRNFGRRRRTYQGAFALGRQGRNESSWNESFEK